MFMSRMRAVVDDRHAVRDPFGPGANDMQIWANTLVKERVATLFLTKAGVAGHTKQIQSELNRLAKVEGRDGTEVIRAICISKFVREALKKAIASSKIHGYHWPRH